MDLASINWFSKIYWIITIPATVGFIIQMITTLVGGELETDVGAIDAEIDADMGVGFQFFTIKNTVAFFTVFGWTGLGCIDAGLNPFLTVFISAIAGTVMVVILSSLFYFMSNMSENGTLQLKNAVGRIGEVYLTIPKNQEGYGKVQIKVQGSLRELEAMTNEIEDLNSGSLVKVLDIINNQFLLVKKINKI
jgi:membrane protein implicated in regulation of membrane protease activity